jgi:hypothetical protein
LGEGAVLGDIGDDVPGAAVAFQAFEHLPQVTAVADPAAPAQPVLPIDLLHIQPDRDPLAVLRDRPRAPLRVFEGGGAEVDPGATGGHRGLQRFVVADPAGQFDGDIEFADDPGEQFTVGATAERGVQIDQMDPFGAVLLPRQGRVAGRTVTGFAARRALYQADGLSIGDIDSGQQHKTHSEQPSR